MCHTRSADDALVESFDWTAASSVTDAVVQVVSNATGVDPVELDPLYDTLNPEALNTIFSRASAANVPTEGRIEFPYDGHRIVIKANGRGYLYDRTEPISPAVAPLDKDAGSSE